MISSHRNTASQPPRSGPFRALRLVPAGLLAVIALAGCEAEDKMGFGWPRGISPQAEEMRRLWTWSVVAALAVGVFVWGLIFWCVLRYRMRHDELPVQTRYNLPIEILYSVVPILIVVVLFYYTAVAQTNVDKKTANPDVTVNVVAFKWNWKFEYPQAKDAEGELVTTTGSTDEIPILVVPTGKTIRFNERAVDVIHSFWVPALLFKRDVIPGHLNTFEVTVDKRGSYVGRCAELCGTYHANMNFEVRAVSWTDYQKYLEQRQSGASTAQALEGIGQSGHATTTKPFNPERTVRTAS